MQTLPSYQEATARRFWLDLVAPYVNPHDYHSLCLVSRQAWFIFAPKLWRNVLQTVRQAGLDPGDDLDWWLDFVFNKLPQVRDETRALIRILDVRYFAAASYNFRSYQRDQNLVQSFRRVLSVCHSIDSVLLDRHEDLDPAFLVHVKETNKRSSSLQVLSLAGCANTPLLNTFFASPALQSLVFLDVSHIPGSVRCLLQHGILQSLRILKIRGREVEDGLVNDLAAYFRRRLWSLDLSDNKVTDDSLVALSRQCLPRGSLRSGAHFETEGQVEDLGIGTPDYGSFLVLHESDHAASRLHPQRYLIDAPTYSAESRQEYHLVRNTGEHPIRNDSATASTAVLVERDAHSAYDFTFSHGLTHLRLSNTTVSSFAIQRLIRTSHGHLEELDIAYNPLLPVQSLAHRVWPRTAKLYGHLGVEHLLRPVFSSNLRSLRIHHSAVTQIPTLMMEGMSTLARDFLSETLIMTRATRAYPRYLFPDTNPRLTSLTLTCIPRRSSGPLVARLISLLKALSLQERAIQDSSSELPSRRGPGVLKGLRHLKLEFEPDAREEGFSTTEDLDAEDLMISGEAGFSFFEDERAQPSIAKVSASSAASTAQSETLHSSRATGAVLENQNHEYVTHQCEWNGEVHAIPVWAGLRGSSFNVIIHDYRKLVTKDGIRGWVGPATYAQVLAGAPEGSYLFQEAWAAAVMPTELTAPPMKTLMAMKDVILELKSHRRTTRAAFTSLQEQANANGRSVPLGAPHLYWTGNLEVVTENTIPHARPARYWR